MGSGRMRVSVTDCSICMSGMFKSCAKVRLKTDSSIGLHQLNVSDRGLLLYLMVSVPVFMRFCGYKVLFFEPRRMVLIFFGWRLRQN
jgi:hypothetical protein